jgi:hypothetical protein
MRTAFQEIDRILRGELTKPSVIGEHGVPISLFRVGIMLVLLGASYGFFMGGNAVVGRPEPEYRQVLASTIKVPLLFLLTGAITFPSLYVFNALLGTRLSCQSMLKLLFAAGGVTLALLASFGPIVGFFAVSTSSYPFMVFLNLVFFTVAGLMGTQFLWHTLRRVVAAAFSPPLVASPPSESPEPNPETPGPLERIAFTAEMTRVRSVFVVWGIMFAAVGAQMGWVLRPFIGNPDQPFAWLRAKHSNFFEAVSGVIWTLLSGRG